MKAIVCQCEQARVLEPSRVKEAVRGLEQEGYEVSIVDDLCRECAKPSPRFKQALAEASVLAACHPRAVTALLAFSGCPSPADLQLRDLRSQTADPRPTNDVQPSAAPGEPPWPAWYPVIDAERCTNCGRCLNFCLFGVYEPGAERPLVRHPDQCKNNCPACARICPGIAIIFPKLAESPLNGDTISDEHAQSQRVQVDTDTLLGDDIYAGLARRRERAKARLFARQQAEKAEAERTACSKEATE